jgi:anhydro-N-acetylmuramic acid kinase
MQPANILNQIANKPTRKILGLMSGTSLDGLDMVLCELSGTGTQTKASILASETKNYTKKLRSELLSYAYRSSTPQYHVSVLNAQLGRLFGKYVNDFIKRHKLNKKDIDLIASHGQTLFHAPSFIKSKPNSTLQVADADHIAYITGIPVISDFRQKHIAAGGEGAPLSCYADHILFHKKDQKRLFLNIGGISNFTLLDGSQKWENLLTADLGPGNTLIDRFVKLNYRDMDFDENGLISSRGQVDEKSLYRLLDNPFFEKEFPKSTGQELFNERYVLERISTKLDGDDLIATLAAFTYRSICIGFEKLNLSDTEIYVSGGGRFNPTLMQGLKHYCPGLIFKNIDDLGVTADAKEGLLFSVLANESLFGEGLYLAECDKMIRLGKVSFP